MDSISKTSRQAFRRSNESERREAYNLGRLKLLKQLGKSLHRCVDDYAKSNGCRWTVFNTLGAGVINHFKNMSEVEEHLYDVYAIRKMQRD